MNLKYYTITFLIVLSLFSTPLYGQTLRESLVNTLKSTLGNFPLKAEETTEAPIKIEVSGAQGSFSIEPYFYHFFTTHGFTVTVKKEDRQHIIRVIEKVIEKGEQYNEDQKLILGEQLSAHYILNVDVREWSQGWFEEKILFDLKLNKIETGLCLKAWPSIEVKQQTLLRQWLFLIPVIIILDIFLMLIVVGRRRRRMKKSLAKEG